MQNFGYLQRGEDGHAAAEIWRGFYQNSIRKQKVKGKILIRRIPCIGAKSRALKRDQDLKLRRDYDSAVAILEQIPAEVLNIFMRRQAHRGKERPIEQSL